MARSVRCCAGSPPRSCSPFGIYAVIIPVHRHGVSRARRCRASCARPTARTPQVASAGYHEPSLVFLAGTDDAAHRRHRRRRFPARRRLPVRADRGAARAGLPAPRRAIGLRYAPPQRFEGYNYSERPRGLDSASTAPRARHERGRRRSAASAAALRSWLRQIGANVRGDARDAAAAAAPRRCRGRVAADGAGGSLAAVVAVLADHGRARCLVDRARSRGCRRRLVEALQPLHRFRQVRLVPLADSGSR